MQATDGGQANQSEGMDPQPVIVDGPALRSARGSQKITLRRVARLAGVSHGHLSKVERGEHGRPVTPAILRAYERAIGFRIADAVASGELAAFEERRPGPRSHPHWRPGQLTTFQRQSWRAQVASVGAGGSTGTPDRRLLENAGKVTTALDPDNDETMRALGAVTAAVESGGQTGGTVAHALLRWAIDLLAEPSEADTSGLEAMVARLARAAAVTVYRSGRHESARALWLLALHSSVQGDDADLRALVLSDIAEQAATVGYPEDAWVVWRQAAGDDRIGEDTRARLKTVRALIEAAENAP